MVSDYKTKDENREGRKEFKDFNLSAYSKQNFGMFGGEVTRCRFRFRDEMVGIFIDRFGKDIPVTPSKDHPGWSETSVEIALSTRFYGWLFALGNGVLLLSPEKAVAGFQKEMKERLKAYK